MHVRLLFRFQKVLKIKYTNPCLDLSTGRLPPIVLCLFKNSATFELSYPARQNAEKHSYSLRYIKYE